MRRVTGITGDFVRHAVRAGRARPDDDRGAITLIVAAMLVVMIGLAALVVDRGMAADTQRQAQSAADASALAAATVMSTGGGTPAAAAAAGASARQYAAQNFGTTDAEWSTCTDPRRLALSLDGSACLTYDPGARRVRVTLPSRAVPSVFSGIFGISSRTVAGASGAIWGTATGDCLLCVLTDIDGQAGGIQVDGGNVRATNIGRFVGQGGIFVTGGGTFYSGTLGDPNGSTPLPRPGPAPVDPLSTLDYPPLPTGAPRVGSGTCLPGAYISIDGCGAFQAGGIYVLVGKNRNNITINATGVMFFLTCGSATEVHYCDPVNGEEGGAFGGAGNTDLTMSGLTSGPWKGMSVFVDRANTTIQKWRGNGTLTVNDGILYSPNAIGLDTAGGNGTIEVHNGQMIIGKLAMNGGGRKKYHVLVDGIPVAPPSGATPSPAYLTE